MAHRCARRARIPARGSTRVAHDRADARTRATRARSASSGRDFDDAIEIIDLDRRDD